MNCENCGAPLTEYTRFCPYCGSALQSAGSSLTLVDNAVRSAKTDNLYNLVLVSSGSCEVTTAGDLLEDVFGYTEAESANLLSMVPVVVGEKLTAEEAATVAQLYTEYGMQVSVTDGKDQYVDLTEKASRSIFDKCGNLLSGAAAIISALTVANRISAYKRYKKPSLLEKLFHINYRSEPPKYTRNFRPHLASQPLEPRRTIKRSPSQMTGVPHAPQGNRHPNSGSRGRAQGPGGHRH